jgi:putative oxidoreductase
LKNAEHLGKLLLRITCGGMLLLHGSFKVFVEIESVKKMVTDAGLPSFTAYGSIAGEFIAPVFLILGWKTRLAALIIAFNMLMSILVAHRDIMFRLNEYWGWMIETNVLYMMTALVVFFIGAGKYSLSKGIGRWD